VHQLTALAGTTSFRRFDQGFAATNRLRTEGTDHLLEAARASGPGSSPPRASPDGPSPGSAWLPALAAAVGARPPRRLPAWVGRLAASEHAVVLMNQARGASNARAKRELGWRPAWPSWRQGFRAGLGLGPGIGEGYIAWKVS
jgi:hypothetical protein